MRFERSDLDYLREVFGLTFEPQASIRAFRPGDPVLVCAVDYTGWARFCAFYPAVEEYEPDRAEVELWHSARRVQFDYDKLYGPEELVGAKVSYRACLGAALRWTRIAAVQMASHPDALDPCSLQLVSGLVVGWSALESIVMNQTRWPLR